MLYCLIFKNNLEFWRNFFREEKVAGRGIEPLTSGL
jgi:hypothetical protein